MFVLFVFFYQAHACDLACNKNSKCKVLANRKPVCACNAGYYGNNEACVDIDECESNDDACKNSDCVNTDGSFLCRCHEGFTHKTPHECHS